MEDGHCHHADGEHLNLDKYTGAQGKVFTLIDQSFLLNEYKADYKKIWLERSPRLK